jgi:hypothetical protein
MVQALQLAVDDTRGLLTTRDIDTLIALPSIMSEQHFMIGHAVAQEVGYISFSIIGSVWTGSWLHTNSTLELLHKTCQPAVALSSALVQSLSKQACQSVLLVLCRPDL